MSVKGYTHECRLLQRSAEVVTSLGVEIAGTCEPTVMDAENQVLWKKQ